jgi:hypothetical protein
MHAWMLPTCYYWSGLLGDLSVKYIGQERKIY